MLPAFFGSWHLPSFKNSNHITPTSAFYHTFLSLIFPPPSFMYKDTCDYIVSTWIISPCQDPFFNHICKVPFAMWGGIICRFHVLGYGPLSASGGITVLTATSKVLLLLCAFAVTGSIHLEYCIVIPCIYIFNSFLCLLFLLKNCVNETLFMHLIKNCSLYSCFCYHFWLCLFYFCPIAYL